MLIQYLQGFGVVLVKQLGQPLQHGANGDARRWVGHLGDLLALQRRRQLLTQAGERRLQIVQ